ncbi:MAG: O-antigen ligase family protein [Chloroflexi bacterium]|nr:O-antigen ligase family protein [Chloroflexota bacterium]
MLTQRALVFSRWLVGHMRGIGKPGQREAEAALARRREYGLVLALLLAIAAVGMGYALGEVLPSPKGDLVTSLLTMSVFVLLIVADPFAGLLAWLATAPLTKYLFLNIDMGAHVPDLTLNRLCAVMMLAVVVANVARKKGTLPRIETLDFLLILTAVGIGISVPAAGNQVNAFQLYVDSLIIPFFTYYLVRTLVRKPADVDRILWAAFIMVIYSALITIGDQVFGLYIFRADEVGVLDMYSEHVRRVNSIYGNPATLATNLTLVVPFMYGYAIFHWREQRKLMALISLISLAGILLLVVRTSWLVTLIGILIIVFLHPLVQARIRWTVLFALAVSSAWIVYNINTVLRLFSDSHVVSERVMSVGPIFSRLVLYQAAWTMISENPLTGHGLDNFARVYMRYLMPLGSISDVFAWGAGNPHNTVIYILVSSGLVGAVPYISLFLGILVVSVLRFRKARTIKERSLIVSLWGTLAAYFGTGMTEDLIFHYYAAVLFFALVAAVIGTSEKIWVAPEPVARRRANGSGVDSG